MYGPVRTVVWEVGGGDPASYPIIPPKSIKDEVMDYLTTLQGVVIISNMNAKLMLNERHVLTENSFVEMVVWGLPSPLYGSRHGFKYRLALVVNGNCVLRYDNEPGKGDHKHEGEKETPYIFTSPEALLDDFWRDVDKWRS